MSLLPPNASFHELVQECFVAYRGRGTCLSARDVELVDAWATLEVPYEVIARGIRRAAESRLFDAPQTASQVPSLSACRREVDRELAKYLKRSTGGGATVQATTPEPFHVTRHRKLVALLRKLGRQAPALAPGLSRWLPLLPVPDSLEAATRQETLAVALLTRGLPAATRIELLREARLLVQKASVMTARAKLESLRFHRAALLRHALSLPAFW